MRPARSWVLARRRQRGISIVESLVAFVVVAAGTAAAAQLQSRLHLAGDVARERSEALRIGAEAIEDMRSFVAVEGSADVRTYAAIASGESSVDASADIVGAGAAHSLWPRAANRRDGLRRDQVRARQRALDRSRRRRSRGRPRLVHRRRGTGVLGLARARRGRHRRGADRPGRARARRAADRPQPRRRPQRVEAGRGRRDRAGVRQPQRQRRRPLRRRRDVDRDARPVGRLARRMRERTLAARRRHDPVFVGAEPPSAIAAGEAPLPTRVSITLRDGPYPASTACFSEARKTLRRSARAACRSSTCRSRRTPPRRARSTRATAGRSLHRLALHRRAACRRSLVGADRAGRRRLDARPHRSHAPRLSLPRRGAGAIDANIASAGAEIDVGAALIGRNFLVVRGSESCPSEPRTARTEPHQP